MSAVFVEIPYFYVLFLSPGMPGCSFCASADRHNDEGHKDRDSRGLAFGWDFVFPHAFTCHTLSFSETFLEVFWFPSYIAHMVHSFVVHFCLPHILNPVHVNLYRHIL